MMTLEDAKTLARGDRLRVTVPGKGHVWEDDGENEKQFKAGEIVKVIFTEQHNAPQGFAVTIIAGNGVVNVFDEADYDGKYPFERMKEQR